MVQIKFIIVLILIMQTKSESRTVSTKVKFNQRVIAKKEITSLNLNNDENISKIEPKKCDELSALVLNDILGAAFNSRCVLVDLTLPKVRGVDHRSG